MAKHHDTGPVADRATPDELDALFATLADPTRRAVVHRLGRGPASVSELAAAFTITLPSFMKHLRSLETSGVVRTRKSGRVRMCALEPTRLGLIDDWLATQRRSWEGHIDRLERQLDQQKEDP